MSTPTPPSVPGTPPETGAHREIKLISHSPLFYWWPVWLAGFFMAAWTVIEDHRMSILPADSKISASDIKTDAEGKRSFKTYVISTEKDLPKLTENAVRNTVQNTGEAFPTRMTSHAWLGSIFILILLLTVVITNVPLRGLWSFLVIILLIVIGLFISVFHGWDDLFERVQNLRIYINLAGYLTIAIVVLIVWLLATFIFDRRAYVIFTPGQIKVCEHIGASVRTFDAAGVTFEKQRDDLFRHYILGFGSGDLILRTAGADRHEIKMPNVLGIGWQLQAVENMLRERAIAPV